MTHETRTEPQDSSATPDSPEFLGRIAADMRSAAAEGGGAEFPRSGRSHTQRPCSPPWTFRLSAPRSQRECRLVILPIHYRITVNFFGVSFRRFVFRGRVPRGVRSQALLPKAFAGERRAPAVRHDESIPILGGGNRHTEIRAGKSPDAEVSLPW